MYSMKTVLSYVHQSCKAGYYRSRVGPHLGKCIKCDCNGHSRDDYCDPETGECKVSQSDVTCCLLPSDWTYYIS